ncbi:MAG TPA: class 1 fructose-bisphosphatase [Saprospiraceae bacterium]|nr:class 1 fructose-bisphosphatase [Saprospiraceae bacterium]HRO07395.1 class 1 fructose-bisphosphatase [Saprospiraceae bacterium]HRO72847.1 class 1 fructose-bisphosphatase [Saprospiraceae bacterium]HRP40678.1 class 1 fructose-bisphosphatase [Saprospiraceae bacterium]
MQNKIVTLDEFIIRTEKENPKSTGSFSRLLRDIGIAAKIVNREVNKAGLVNILGVEGSTNTTGDAVQKLDIFANEKFIETLSYSGEVCGIASEENQDIIQVNNGSAVNGQYVVVMDPLDGSSNIDVNVSVGTIFGIYKRKSPVDGPCEMEDFLQKGTEMVAAGYVLYGTSTLLVYAAGQGVNGFTLDPSIGEFCLSHRNIKMPAAGNYYSVNQGYYLKFDLEMRRYIDHCSDLNYRLRYIGSMVSDIHRIMFQGGIFLYPNTRKYPKGKLRLLYECYPMAYIIEQAGGSALTCKLERIMDVEIHSLHQTSSIAMGSGDMVRDMKEFVERYGAVIQ